MEENVSGCFFLNTVYNDQLFYRVETTMVYTLQVISQMIFPANLLTGAKHPKLNKQQQQDKKTANIYTNWTKWN